MRWRCQLVSSISQTEEEVSLNIVLMSRDFRKIENKELTKEAEIDLFFAFRFARWMIMNIHEKFYLLGNFFKFNLRKARSKDTFRVPRPAKIFFSCHAATDLICINKFLLFFFNDLNAYLFIIKRSLPTSFIKKVREN